MNELNTYLIIVQPERCLVDAVRKQDGIILSPDKANVIATIRDVLSDPEESYPVSFLWFFTRCHSKSENDGLVVDCKRSLKKFNICGRPKDDQLMVDREAKHSRKV